jgi:alpha-L-glutamate ligase-like protein
MFAWDQLLVGMNKRNLRYVYNYNERKHFPLVDNKLLSKELFSKHLIPHPKTIIRVKAFYEIESAMEHLADFDEAVIKPARGSGGGGIMVLKRDNARNWVTPSGQLQSHRHIARHLADIIFGSFSFGGSEDAAIIEELIHQHYVFDTIYSRGVSDIRIIMLNNQCVLAMLRLPADTSDGKANLHQGGIGVPIDLATGRTGQGLCRGKRLDHHPDTGQPLSNILLPYWQDILKISTQAAKCVPLNYIGVDLVLDEHLGPLVLELNARPGLQIQVVNHTPLGPLLTAIEDQL